MPSWATSQPAASTSRRSAELRSSRGLVLLMWISTLRFTPRSANAAMVPSGPDTLMWPMRCPVFTPAPWWDHLVVAPQGAVEQHRAAPRRGAGARTRPAWPRTPARRRSDPRPPATKPRGRSCLPPSVSEVVAARADSPGRARPCPARRRARSQCREPGRPASAAGAAIADLHGAAVDEGRVQHIEDAVVGQHVASTRAMAVDREWLAFAQSEQPGDVVDVPLVSTTAEIGLAAGPPAGMQRGVVVDLLADVGGRVQQHPSPAIGADGDGGLSCRPHGRIARADTTGGRVVGIPLRKAAAGGGAENQDFHGCLPEESAGPPAGGPASCVRSRRRRSS